MKKLVISFSGGETSAFMTQYLWRHKKNEYDMYVVFANTGEENEETLQFVEKFSSHFNIPVTWVEAVTRKGRQSTYFNIVDFESASRDGEPFEDVISKYGIPNQAFPHCTRELKLQPIRNFVKFHLGWDDYYTAIGIREDEVDRVNSRYKKEKLIYPLITDQPMSKQKINFWWSQQPFRLNLKGYQGNCKTCWKKNPKKLYAISKENPEWFDNFRKWESEYGELVLDTRSKKNPPPYRFFRGNKSVDDIFKEAENFNRNIKDDSQENSFQVSMLDFSESCDILSMCGEDN